MSNHVITRAQFVKYCIDRKACQPGRDFLAKCEKKRMSAEKIWQSIENPFWIEWLVANVYGVESTLCRDVCVKAMRMYMKTFGPTYPEISQKLREMLDWNDMARLINQAVPITRRAPSQTK